ncbi:MAG TPA: RHS repeat-associated core domain-containing protein [Solirubrobacteraceae bacterium]|jgi:RHS repeat-associated protein|nr:RHS repeat-associated core domain-containing protein [Solirubrobacteraceae bacterium]
MYFFRIAMRSTVSWLRRWLRRTSCSEPLRHVRESHGQVTSVGGHIFIYGATETSIAQINNSTGTVEYLHHDQAGSTRLLTGSTGTVTGKCTYNAYGTPTCEGTATTPLGYDGQYTSSDTGLVYMRARTYDPATAQFLSVDPFVALTGEPYSYVGDDPVNNVDPLGLSSEGLDEGSVPCFWPFCGPPPSAPEGVKQLGEGVAEGARESYEGIMHGAESIWNAITGEGASSNESTTEDKCAQDSPRSLLPRGEPNSTGVLDRGSGTGQIRDYGPDGLPLRDFDFGHDHGFGDPHLHEWLEGVRGPGQPLGPNE